MSRAAPSDVKIVVDTDLSDSDVQAFLDDASLIVDEFASALDGDGARSKAVEKYFAAELLASRDPRAESASAGGTRVDYQRKDGEGFFQSDHGEKADRLSGDLLRETLEQEGSAIDWQIGTYG